MPSEKQILANRLNARRSTGPRTLAGKYNSRRNAFKHGLTSRTIIDACEPPTEFQAFRDQIAQAYRPHSILDQELINRLAGLLWRLSRAHAIETGILTIQADIQSDLRRERGKAARSDHPILIEQPDPVQLAHAFLRASNLNGDALDRLSRYEISLWRQAAQIIFLLAAIAKPRSARLRREHGYRELGYADGVTAASIT